CRSRASEGCGTHQKRDSKTRCRCVVTHWECLTHRNRTGVNTDWIRKRSRIVSHSILWPGRRWTDCICVSSSSISCCYCGTWNTRRTVRELLAELDEQYISSTFAGLRSEDSSLLGFHSTTLRSLEAYPQFA